MTNGIARRLPRSAGLPPVVQRLGGMVAAAFVLAASSSAFACHLSGHAARCVTGYKPSSVSSGAAAVVDVVGRDLGNDLHAAGWRVSYGTGAGPARWATVH